MTITYAVTITNPGMTGTGAGFIDANLLGTYEGEPTETNSLNKRRGNLRYKSIIMTVGLVSNPTVSNLEFPDSTFEDEASECMMEMSFVSSESLTIVRNGTTYYEEDALQMLIAEAISFDIITTTDYYHPTLVSAVAEITVGKLAANPQAALSLITVTPL